MKPGDLEKLLGGYAAGNLTPEEQRELHRAALADQRLFDLLADEQGLKELLAEPATREDLLQAIAAAGEVPETKLVPIRPRRAFWTWPLAAAAGCVLVGIGLMTVVRERPEIAVQQIAQAPEPVPLSVEHKRQQPPALAEHRPISKPPGERLARAPAAAPSAPQPRQEGEERSDLAAARKVVASESVALGKVEADVLVPRLAAKDDAALSWRLQRKSSVGAYDIVPAGQPLNAGEEARIEVSPAAAGILTAELVEGDERLVLLSQPVEPGNAYLVPREGGLPSRAGTRRVVLVLSPQPPGAATGFRQAAAPAKPPHSAEIKLEFR